MGTVTPRDEVGRYCQTKGPKRNELIMKELQFESASWIHEAIQETLDATKTMRAPVVRTREQQEQEELKRRLKTPTAPNKRRTRMFP